MANLFRKVEVAASPPPKPAGPKPAPQPAADAGRVGLAALLGFCFSFLSFLYFGFIILSAFNGNVDVKGFSTIVALISFFFGVVISAKQSAVDQLNPTLIGLD